MDFMTQNREWRAEMRSKVNLNLSQEKYSGVLCSTPSDEICFAI